MEQISTAESTDNGVMVTNAASAEAKPRRTPRAKKAARPDERDPLDELDGGVIDLVERGQKAGLSVASLAQWSGRTKNAARLRALIRLGEQRAGLLLAGARAEAAKALLRLATDADSGETARKACVDLLKLSVADVTNDAESVERAGGTRERGGATGEASRADYSAAIKKLEAEEQGQ